MVAEYLEIRNLNDARQVVRVVLFDFQQNTDLYFCLVCIPLLILYDFQSHGVFLLVVVDFEDLAVGSLSQEFQDFIPVSDMIIQDILVLKTKISTLLLWSVVLHVFLSNFLSLSGLVANEVHLLVFLYFFFFVPRQEVRKFHQDFFRFKRDCILVPLLFRSFQAI